MSEKKEYDNSNTFVLFVNNKKTKDTHPDYTGKYYDEDGKEHYLSGWVKSSERMEDDFISGSVISAEDAKAKFSKEKDNKPATKVSEPKEVTASGDDGVDSDLPF